MTVQDFFQLSAGAWLCQRTRHHLETQQSESERSRLEIQLLTANDPIVVERCLSLNLDPGQALGVIIKPEVTQESKSKTPGEVTLVLIPDAADATHGKVLRYSTNSGQSQVNGSYKLGSDEALTLWGNHDGVETEERIWFASPNLRFRTATVKGEGGFKLASFITEIRKLTTPPAATPQA